MKIVDISPFKGSTVCIELSGGGLAQNMKIYLHRDIAAEVSKGMDITEEQADMLIHKNDMRKARERALYLMESRDHSYSELFDKLEKNYPEDECFEVCSRLAELGIINDRRYAEKLCRQLFEIKKLGKYRVRQEMRMKGIPGDIIDETLEEFAEEDDSFARLEELVEKKYERYLVDRKGVEKVLRTRSRLCPLRMEYTRMMNDSIIEKMCGFLGLTKKQVFHSISPLDLSFLFKVEDLLRNEKYLFYERRVPQQPAMIDRTRPVMEQAREHDLFLSYPYESMKPFIQLLNEAANDPEVVSIKMTLYRLASDSKIVEALVEAAEQGKEVVVLVELRARFDEENNIRWSRQLEDAGCRVIYGLNHMKVHSKLCLITGKRNNKIEYITQIGTGNYNEKTSRIYTDYSLITSSVDIGNEAANVFNHLSMGTTVDETQHLLVAPNCLQNKVLAMIDEEIAKAKEGKEGYVGVKINSLTDKKIIDKLIEAGKAGVKIRMIVRGICCLKAGVAGETDNIRIISIVGRFLEHSRIYIFGKDDPKVYIASADFMTRNTVHRVEVAAPVYDPAIKARILDDFELFYEDDQKAREQINGIYLPKHGESHINAQEAQYAQAYKNNEIHA